MVVHTLRPSKSADDGFSVGGAGINLTTGVINPAVGDWLIVRYPNAPIYPGSTINSAVFTTKWYQKSGSTAQTATGTLKMEKTLNPPALAQGVSEHNRTKTTASATHSVTWDTTAAPTNMSFSTDIKALLQEVIAQPGWARGNAITVFLNFTSESGSAEIRSWDAYSDDVEAPQLVIDWTPPVGVTVPPPPTVVLNDSPPQQSNQFNVTWSYSDPSSDPQVKISYSTRKVGQTGWSAETTVNNSTQSQTVSLGSTAYGDTELRLRAADTTGEWSDYDTTILTMWSPPAAASNLTPRKSTYLTGETAEFDFTYSDPDGHALAGYELRWREVV